MTTILTSAANAMLNDGANYTYSTSPFSLPTSPHVGFIQRIRGDGNAWTVNMPAGHSITGGISITSISSTIGNESIELQYMGNNTWSITNLQGQVTVS